MYQVVDTTTQTILLETENLQEAQAKHDYGTYYGDHLTIKEVWTNALVIGPHQSELPDLNIVETRNITWGATRQEVEPVLYALIHECIQNKWVLLFQNTPGQLTSALTRWVEKHGMGHINVGVIVSKPSAMPSAPLKGKVQLSATFGDAVEVLRIYDMADEVMTVMQAMNPRATCTMERDATSASIHYSVEPPRPFVFDHIEWL